MKKILLVEDNEAIQKGLKYSLEQEKFVVELASDVKTAKDKLVKSEFNLIILDVMLPDGSGFELCRDIKKNMMTPILFLTAKDEEQDVVNGFDLGADDYVVKPFRPRELISRINNILRRYEKEESNKLTGRKCNNRFRCIQSICRTGRNCVYSARIQNFSTVVL